MNEKTQSETAALVWVPLGIVLGIGFGIALENMVVGLVVGVVFGLALALGFRAQARRRHDRSPRA